MIRICPWVTLMVFIHATAIASCEPPAEKKVRLNLGLTQDQMGDLMKVTGRNYNNYERERVQNVPAPALQRLLITLASPPLIC